MSDEFETFAKAMRAATPAPDPSRKAAVIAAARKKFEAAQETAQDARPIPKPAQNVPGFWKGVKDMFQSFTLRPVLYATSAICVAGLAVIITKPLTNFPTGPGETYTTSDIVVNETFTNHDKDNSIGQPKKRAQKPVKAEEALPPSPRLKTDQTVSTITSGAVNKESYADFDRNGIILPEASHETFPDASPNPLKITTDEPVSTFSIDVDTASYAYVRSAIENGTRPVAEAVRIEEMINYFPYDYAAPDITEAPFSTTVSTFETPWNVDTRLVHIGIQGAKAAVETRPPLNLVFLIDTSGSMQDPNKLPLLKQSFRLLLNTLRPTDNVAIVTYAGSAGAVLEPTAADQKDKILAALDRLGAGSSTAGQAGLQQAYALAETMQSDDSIARVLLATDGDFNVGISDPEALKTFVEEKRDTGVYLSVFGYGRGNYRDDMMQSLAQNGNGTAAYIDTLAEAQKVMVDQVAGALFPIANDVKIQVEFNPATVAEYRLIGYETRILNREDFNNDGVDAGEIGAGHTVTALYEITPVGSPAIKNDALRYQPASEETAGPNHEFGFLKLRYKNPGEETSKLITTPITQETGTASAEVKFATAIAGFGQLLKEDKYLNGWTWDQNIALALEGKGEDAFGYRAEAIQLMRLAQSLE